MNPAYIEQTRLMLRVLPFVAKEDCFALKGGTAINFFVRDMPRLSVDIDLVYLPINSREEALAGISAALKKIKADAPRGLGQGFTAQEGVVERSGQACRIEAGCRDLRPVRHHHDGGHHRLVRRQDMHRPGSSASARPRRHQDPPRE